MGGDREVATVSYEGWGDRRSWGVTDRELEVIRDV